MFFKLPLFIACVPKFGTVSTCMTIVEILLVWYIGEMVFKNQYEIDEIGMAECLKFFTVTLSTGIALLVASVGKIHHEYLLSYVGLPLDFSNKYIVHTR